MESSMLSSCGASSMMSKPVVKRWSGKRRRGMHELLMSRQTFGKPSTSNIGLVSRRGISMHTLSSQGAWNPRRMQNMVLAVGPGTPASVLTSHIESAPSSSSSSSSPSSSAEASNDDDESESGEEDAPMEDADNVEQQDTPRPARSRWTRSHMSDNDTDDSGEDDCSSEGKSGAQIVAEQALLDFYRDDDDESQKSETTDVGMQEESAQAPSMRHGGCINTAAWMDCGWRIALNGGGSREMLVSEECPTQLVTSGDDHLVKFWDVRNAMGTISPMYGGSSTICPFSSPDCADLDDVRHEWKRQYSKAHSNILPGSVTPLATLATGHHGNVFHVTPLCGKPGKVVTCGADGFLRMTDLETKDATVIFSPEYEDDMGGLLLAGLMTLRAGMCFSHHFLSQNTGLLCSERGLRRFDLRLPAREQSTRSLLDGLFGACKACAVWSSSKGTSSLEEGDSTYVFAGGSSAEVALCDLRMADGASSRVVQQYCPRDLTMTDSVSVSGLDVSRDRQELLVSYESDQVYTFPIFPAATSITGPTIDEIGRLTQTSERGGAKVLPELACYGGHLNRLTFLKNAKYAGPKDEYICTGSDSGRAWIYEKATGAVVSFLNADHSTCNGVIPHPTMPFFITYGIDSTAKLWRATLPVDPEVDDSAEGRRKCFQESAYEMSSTVRKWKEVQQVLRIFESEDCKETDILPDYIPGTQILLQGKRSVRHFLKRDPTKGSPVLGNDLHNLPDRLQRNLYACLRSLLDGDDMPVESGFQALKHRISLIRLRHQADRLGLPWNPSLPWQLEEAGSQIAGGESVEHVHPADLIPAYPSDWIPYDPEMSKAPWDFRNYFNLVDYEDFYGENYVKADNGSSFNPEGKGEVEKAKAREMPVLHKENHMPSTNGVTKVTTKKARAESDEGSLLDNKDLSTPEAVDGDDELKYAQTVHDVFYQTMRLLKDAGNRALQEGHFDLAAHRYDKCIRYGAVTSMSFPVRNLHFAKGRRELLKENGGYHLQWGPLIRTLVVSRLNLALLMLKVHFSQPDQTIEQANWAIHDLKPFCVTKGKIMKGNKVETIYRDDEPEETYIDAMTLQAKAHFRLGSARYELGEYAEAISCYEKSIQCTQKVKAKPDSLVLRKLSEAKRENYQKRKRHRKKFKFAFGAESDESVRNEKADETG